MTTDIELKAITERIIGCAFAVSRELRPGFAERVYENALTFEMYDEGLRVERQLPITVRCKQRIVGEYVADLLVEDRVLVELKAVRALNEAHVAQCLNYLNGTGLSTCLLLNFGTPRVGIRRVSLGR